MKREDTRELEGNNKRVFFFQSNGSNKNVASCFCGDFHLGSTKKNKGLLVERGEAK